MARPYISWSIERIETLFEEEGGAPEIRSQIKEELSFRSTKRAQTLLRLVDEAARQIVTAPKPHSLSFIPEKVQEDIRDAEANQEPSGQGDVVEAAELTEDWTERDYEDEPEDLAPDDRHLPAGLSQIRPLGTAGLPGSWIRPLDRDLTLSIPADADIPDIYCAALAALIAEIKKTGSGQKRYELEKGVRRAGDAGEVFYDFPFTDDAELFEDAKVEVELPGRRIEATIVSISSGRLLLAIRDDLGPDLHRAVIVVDATALLEALREKVEQAGKGEVPINRLLADSVIGKGDLPANPPAMRSAEPAKRPNPEQKEAVRRALSDSVTYLWGPPGTGKTQVLGDVVRAAFENDKRVLICSNTNKAVDQVLYKICESLGRRHPAMEDGEIVRMGRIALDKLSSQYEQYVTVDGIVERKSVDLKARELRAQEALARIDARTAKASYIVAQFLEFEAAQTRVQLHKDATNVVARNGRELKAKQEELNALVANLNRELVKPKHDVLTFFNRSEQAIRKDLDRAKERLRKVADELEETRPAYANAKEQFELATQERDRLERQLAGVNRVAAEGELAKANAEREPIVEELREIESKLADLRAAVLKGAKVLGATCTKTYLSAKEVGQVDMVIVDEASMVLLPMIWFAAGRAKERVVICGDFRQIPPIVPTNSQAIFDVLGEDVFSAAGLAASQGSDRRMVMLESQYRMHEDICALISQPMYEGRLRTGKREADGPPAPPPYDHTLTIVDTSDLWPFESVNAYFSRFNLMHALLVRNLAWHFHQEGYITREEDFSVCTPYAAQAKLIRKLLETETFDTSIQVGTVHSFQGDERNAVVLELPESHGGARMIGQFLQGLPPSQVGARLINVAVSRAKAQLIVLANLTYLDRLLPSTSLLRGILYDMQQSGRVISGSDLLALRPIESDLRGLLGHIELDFDAETLGLFDGAGFSRAVETDIAKAKGSVVLFSGFVTPSRVGKIGDLLRLKISEGVKIRCVTRPPHLNGTLDPEQSRQALDMLENIGCVVDCRARIHEKIVVIDKEVVWHGSLNVLSHNHRTDESMTRIVGAGFAQAVAVNMSKRHVSNDVALQTVATAENPRCGQCGRRTFYDEGKFGPYFRCEQKCGWSSSLRSAERGSPRPPQGTDPTLPADGPRCPICKGKTRLRTGRFGPFYGCIKYPACSGKCQPPAKGKTSSGRSSSEKRA